MFGQPLRQPALAGTGIADDQGSGEVHERLRSIVGAGLLAKAVCHFLDIAVMWVIVLSSMVNSAPSSDMRSLNHSSVSCLIKSPEQAVAVVLF
ncbi:hypothetical protein D3C84_1013130 [compost metagenome]